MNYYLDRFRKVRQRHSSVILKSKRRRARFTGCRPTVEPPVVICVDVVKKLYHSSKNYEFSELIFKKSSGQRTDVSRSLCSTEDPKMSVPSWRRTLESPVVNSSSIQAYTNIQLELE